MKQTVGGPGLLWTMETERKKITLHNSHSGVKHTGRHTNPMLKEANQAFIWIYAPRHYKSISKILNPVQNLQPEQITNEKTLYTPGYSSCLNLSLSVSQDIHIGDQGWTKGPGPTCSP